MTGPLEPNEAELLKRVRRYAAAGIVALVGLVVLLDRIGPILSPDYAPIGDTALGMLIGFGAVLLGVQGVDEIIKRRNGTK